MQTIKQKLLLLVCALLAATSFNAQAPSQSVYPTHEWSKYPTYRWSLQNNASSSDASNNICITGSGDLNGHFDVILSKHDSLGNSVFLTNFDNGGQMDEGRDLVIDPLQNIYVCGYTENSSQKDFLVLAYDAAGNLLWDYMHDVHSSDDEAVSITYDPVFDVLYITGYSTTGNGDKNIHTLCLRSDGTYHWSHDFDGAASLDDFGTDVVVSSDGTTCYVTGMRTESSGEDIAILSYDASNGSLNWDFAIDGPSSGSDIGKAMTLSGANIVVTGAVYNSSSRLNYATIKFDGSNGSVIWDSYYDFQGFDDISTGLVKDSVGNIAVTGYALNSSGIYEYHTILYDSLGSGLWLNTESTNANSLYSEPKIAMDTVVNSFYICGEKKNANSDVFVYHVDNWGNTQWKKCIQGSVNGIDAGSDITVSAWGDIYVSANTENSSNGYDITAIKISQTPYYFPPDSTGELPSLSKMFYENKGQIADTNHVSVPEVLYYNHSTGQEYYIQKHLTSYVLRKTDTLGLDTMERIDLITKKGNIMADIFPFEEGPTKMNYLLSHLSEDGIMNVQSNKRLFVPNVMPGVDLHYFSNANGLKYYYVFKPLISSVNSVTLEVDGAQSAGLTSGHLMLNGLIDTIDVGTLRAYQVNLNSSLTNVTASWTAHSSTMYGFNVPSYTYSLPLIVMVSKPVGTLPSVAPIGNMDYSTYYGASGGHDHFFDVWVNDNTGDRFVTGYTEHVSFPNSSGLFTYKGGRDAIALKYSATDSLRYSLVYGGTDWDWGVGIRQKSNGNVYVVGNARSIDLTTKTTLRPAASQQTLNGQSTLRQSPRDGFILELSHGTGNNIHHKWSRYMGGVWEDVINDVTMDRNDNLIFVGTSNSCNYPKVSSWKSGPSQCGQGLNYDWVISKIDSTGNLVFSTYYGSDNVVPPCSGCIGNLDVANAVDVDTLGYVYIVGSLGAQTNDLGPVNFTSNTTTTSIYNPVLSGGGAILMRMDGAYFRDLVTEVGTASTTIEDVKVMPNQNVLFSGWTMQDSTTFPLKKIAGSYFRSIPSAPFLYKGYVAMIDNSSTNLWCTHFNRGGDARVSRIATASDNSFYLAGHILTDSLFFPSSTLPGVYTKTTRQNRDGWISYFTTAAGIITFRHSHFLGGGGEDFVEGIDVYRKDALYATGSTGSANFPVVGNNPSLLYNQQGWMDGFITRFDLSPIVISVKEYDEKQTKSIQSFPNPVSYQFYINMQELGTEKFSVSAYNMMGQLIYEEKISNFNSDLFSVDCNSWTNGLYIITVKTENKTYSGKIIKQ